MTPVQIWKIEVDLMDKPHNQLMSANKRSNQYQTQIIDPLGLIASNDNVAGKAMKDGANNAGPNWINKNFQFGPATVHTMIQTKNMDVPNGIYLKNCYFMVQDKQLAQRWENNG